MTYLTLKSVCFNGIIDIPIHICINVMTNDILVFIKLAVKKKHYICIMIYFENVILFKL